MTIQRIVDVHRPSTPEFYPTCCPLVCFSLEDAARDEPCAHGNPESSGSIAIFPWPPLLYCLTLRPSAKRPEGKAELFLKYYPSQNAKRAELFNLLSACRAAQVRARLFSTFPSDRRTPGKLSARSLLSDREHLRWRIGARAHARDGPCCQTSKTRVHARLEIRTGRLAHTASRWARAVRAKCRLTGLTTGHARMMVKFAKCCLACRAQRVPLGVLLKAKLRRALISPSFLKIYQYILDE